MQAKRAHDSHQRVVRGRDHLGQRVDLLGREVGRFVADDLRTLDAARDVARDDSVIDRTIEHHAEHD